jgi:hypothetical protein
LEYEPAIAIGSLNESVQIEIAQLTELAKQVLNRREKFSANIQKGDKAIIGYQNVCCYGRLG